MEILEMTLVQQPYEHQQRTRKLMMC